MLDIVSGILFKASSGPPVLSLLIILAFTETTGNVTG